MDYNIFHTISACILISRIVLISFFFLVFTLFLIFHLARNLYLDLVSNFVPAVPHNSWFSILFLFMTWLIISTYIIFPITFLRTQFSIKFLILQVFRVYFHLASWQFMIFNSYLYFKQFPISICILIFQVVTDWLSSWFLLFHVVPHFPPKVYLCTAVN